MIFFQYSYMGTATDRPLMEWLDHYTFPRCAWRLWWSREQTSVTLQLVGALLTQSCSLSAWYLAVHCRAGRNLLAYIFTVIARQWWLQSISLVLQIQCQSCRVRLFLIGQGIPAGRQEGSKASRHYRKAEQCPHKQAHCKWNDHSSVLWYSQIRFHSEAGTSACRGMYSLRPKWQQMKGYVAFSNLVWSAVTVTKMLCILKVEAAAV